MTSIVKADDGVASGSAGLKSSADSSGTLELQATSGLVSMANVTGGLTVPTGTTAQRPGTPAVGTERWNTTLGSLEIYDGSAWGSVGGGGPGSLQAVQTTGFTAVSGNVYYCNTTSAAFTVTLPASPTAGSYIILTDYARTWFTNNLTINPNGNKIQGSTSNVVLAVNGQSVSIMYVDSTQGWLAYTNSVTELTNYTVSYLVLAGGAAGGGGGGGGGGAGGLLTSTASLATGTAYTITVGGGGAGNNSTLGANGGNSSFGSIAVAIGGGGGGGANVSQAGAAGGSGGGSAPNGGGVIAGGSGTSGQGNAGGSNGTNSANYPGGGGGGAGTVGQNGVSTTQGGAGGSGAAYSISGASITYAGGGGGGLYGAGAGGGGGSGGGGGGGAAVGGNGANGTANLGGGGGGTGQNGTSGSGGSGIVIISYAGAQRGSGGTVTTAGGNTIHTFTSSGTFTA